MASRYSEFLRRTEIFENIADADLDKISDLMQERTLDENQVLFNQGDDGDALYVVLDGQIRVFIVDASGEQVLAVYDDGDVLGENSLLSGERRSASAAALRPTRLLALQKEDFDSYLTGNVQVMREMMRIIAVRQEQTNARLAQRVDVPAAAAPKRSIVITVFSPRGGSGKSTVAVNLAAGLARLCPNEVVLIDLSLTFAHCALLLNLLPRASLAEISASAMSRLDADGLGHLLTPHASTLKLLAGSLRPEDGEQVGSEHVRGAIEGLKKQFSAIVIDTPSNFAEPVIAALEAADYVLMVCTPEMTTLRDVRECQRIFQDLISIPKSRVSYVMNQIFPHKALPLEQFVDALEQRMDYEIPYGNDVPTKAAIRGEAFVLTQPASNVAKAIEGLAARFGKELKAGAPVVPERKGGFLRR